MRHFYRSHLVPADVLTAADRFFTELGLQNTAAPARARTFSGPLGALRLTVKPEGGHYAFVQVETNQMGESRLDRNVKRFFVSLHRAEDPRHVLEAAY
ncbi:MAG: hypothetical protein B7Z72_08630 [Gemmatimonadetes bacterium 21-71-4]|nr:MAG: hypothetical protein B7Z72_08630 [Gemmatimonadetes bacterium 21-71-4]